MQQATSISPLKGTKVFLCVDGPPLAIDVFALKTPAASLLSSLLSSHQQLTSGYFFKDRPFSHKPCSTVTFSLLFFLYYYHYSSIMLLARHAKLPSFICRAITASTTTTTGTCNSTRQFHFELNEDQRALRDLSRKFAREVVAPKARHHDQTGEYPWDIIKQAHELGIMTHYLPENVGGGGLGLFESCKLLINR